MTESLTISNGPEKRFVSEVNTNENNVPTSVSIKDDGREILKFNFDSVDCMGFCNASPLLALSAADRKEAVTCLADTLKNSYGGKNMLAVPAELVPLFEEAGFNTSPKVPNGNSYNRLMAADMVSVAAKCAGMAGGGAASLALLHEQFEPVTDKNALRQMSKDISALLIKDAAEFAGTDDKKPYYTPQAVAERIGQDNVHSLALVDKKTKKPVAFIRGYVKEGVGAYVSDMVAAKVPGSPLLGASLMSDAVNFLQDNVPCDTLYLIAGNDREVAFYNKTLGFEQVAKRESALPLSEGTQFMFGLFPQQQILKDLPKTLKAIPVIEPAQTTPDAAPAKAAKHHR